MRSTQSNRWGGHQARNSMVFLANISLKKVGTVLRCCMYWAREQLPGTEGLKFLKYLCKVQAEPLFANRLSLNGGKCSNKEKEELDRGEQEKV